jgi:hypothetical protein
LPSKLAFLPERLRGLLKQNFNERGFGNLGYDTLKPHFHTELPLKYDRAVMGRD